VALRALDNELKAAGHNPGTTADLTVASLFAFELAQALRECRPPPE
jgi:triphosphoribosyl-dephospho-CoA synthetase